MSFFLLTMQSYGDFLPIPRKIPNSSLTCSDNRPHVSFSDLTYIIMFARKKMVSPKTPP